MECYRQDEEDMCHRDDTVNLLPELFVHLQELEDLQPKEGEQLPPGLKAIDGGRLALVKAKAGAAADVLMLTDAPLLFPPGQLALAALRSAMKSVSRLEECCPPSLNDA